MRTLYTWGSGDYCWIADDNAGDEQEILDDQRESLLESACPACGQKYRECACPEEFDPFADPQ